MYLFKIITPGKIVPSKCCLPSWNISVKDFTQTFFLTNITHFQILSVTFTEYRQNVSKHHLIDKAILGKMGVVYVKYVAHVDKGQYTGRLRGGQGGHHTSQCPYG